MASFCTKCGATLSPETKFCTGCGAPTGAVPPAAESSWSAAPVSPALPPQPAAGAYQTPPYQAAPPQAPPYQAAPYQPGAYAPPIAPPGSSGGTSAVKVILIIVGVIVGLGVLGIAIFAFTVWRVAKSVHVDEKNGEVTLNTPGGRFSANSSETFTAAELGTDVYPGAVTAHGSAKLDLPTVSMVTGVFETTDPKDKVIAYYKDKFGSGNTSWETEDGAMLTLTKSEKESVMVTISQKASEDDGKTKIAIVHTKKQ